jgi:hypothetical protein
MRRLSSLALAGLLAACAGEPAPPPTPVTVTPEAVERYRTRVVVALQPTDSTIAALETAAAQADSAGAAAYGAALTALRRERREIQAQLDSLHGMTPERFAAATAALDRRLDEFDERVGDTPVELAQDAAQLRAASAQRLLEAEAEVRAFPPAVAARAVTDLQVHRQQIEGTLALLGSPDVRFDSLHAVVANQFMRLFDRIDALGLPGGAEPGVTPGAPPAAP